MKTPAAPRHNLPISVYRPCWIVALFIASFPCNLLFAAPPAKVSDDQRKAQVLSRRDVNTLKSDPALQGKVRFEAIRKPLGNVLAELSKQLPVDLVASRNVIDQRVTLYIQDQSLAAVMASLCGLLSHDPAHPHGYYWEALARGTESKPGYRLRRDSASIHAEAEAQKAPLKQLVAILRELRQLSRTPVNKKADHVGTLPPTYLQGSDTFGTSYREASASLSNSQCADLARGEHVPVTTSNGYTGMYIKSEDDGGKWPENADKFGVYLEGPRQTKDGLKIVDSAGDTEIGHLIIDPLHPNFLKSPLPKDFPAGGPPVDLTPLMVKAGVTDDDRRNVDFILLSLAKAARFNLYRETFVEAPALRTLSPLKAPLDMFVAKISTTFECTIEKTTDAYFVCDRDWPMKRAADISDTELSKWKQRSLAVPCALPEDYIAICRSYTWPQVGITLHRTLPGWCPIGFDGHYRGWWLYSNVVRNQGDEPSSVHRLPLSELGLSFRQTFIERFSNELANLSADEISNIVFQTTTDTFHFAPQLANRRIIISGELEGRKITRSILNYELVTQKSVSSKEAP